MTEQKEYCSRCHGSGRVGYVREDGRRGHTRCPDCQGVPAERKAYVEGTMRNQRTLSLSEVPQAVWDALRDPTTTPAPANAPRASNAQQTAFPAVTDNPQWTPEDEQMFSEAWEAWTWE